MFRDKETFKRMFVERLVNQLGKPFEEATEADIYNILGRLIREHVGKAWADTNQQLKHRKEKQVYYFSMEFLIGRMLGNNLLNLGALNTVRGALKELGWDLEKVEEQEADAGLGNGGLGRLAACFLDSLASLNYAGHGCGIRYKYGLFEQKIIDGNQVELPDDWLQRGNVWEERRSDKKVEVRFWGHVECREVNDRLHFDTVNYESVWAVPYDVPIIGYGGLQVNTLRLWSAESAVDPARLTASSDQSYQQFLAYNRSVESISEFLYPDDSGYEGKLLRLKQQYFMCSAGLQSILRTFDKLGLPYVELPKHVSMHINDTHPTLLIPELMRILVDEKQMGWDEAWAITRSSISYTNHTILSEALEKWPVPMVRELLPRIYMIIEEINKRFCGMLLEQFHGQQDKVTQLAIIEGDQIKMAHLAIVGSNSVNGVAALHTELLKHNVMKPFYELYPARFNNKTNGITHRRWLMHANPGLSQLISEGIGNAWMKQPHQLIELLRFKDDSRFLQELSSVKRRNKIKLAATIMEKQGIVVDPDSIFDVHVKRLHGYKRQLLNILHVMHLYNEIKAHPNLDRTPRTFIFAAKAAPGYYLAKNIIKLINVVARTVNHDPQIRGLLKVIFLENYAVSLAETIIPAAEVSEQISTASKEASGTGNMKFMMNGALTIGTLDGANVEMHELVGDDHMFIFGLRSQEVLDYYQYGGYLARTIYHSDERVKRVMDQLVKAGPFCRHEGEFEHIFQSILEHNDEYFVLKDFDAYTVAQQLVDHAYHDSKEWQSKAVINIAHSGAFASDRTIKAYASEIWNISPIDNYSITNK